MKSNQNIDESPLLDQIIEKIFKIIDTYYIERQADQIRVMLICYAKKGLLEELRRLADKGQ